MGYANRWYDREPQVQAGVNTLLVFPAEIQGILGEGLMLLANKQFQADKLVENYKSLGTEKVLAMYKSMQKKRAYDQIAGMQTTMNYLFFLSVENRNFMVEKIHDISKCMTDYMQECRNYKRDVDLENVQEMTHTFVEKGTDEVQQYIKNFRDDLLRSIKGGTVESPIKESQVKTRLMADEDSGMRISFKDL